ncbi:MAG: Gfo/Idh/MocA family oxidoreductase, partial [Anaerolineaceae bacterium]|nr:Gfo/Idh/MocA family oxidoreductase [Anaerolineaceae bacterium]
MKAAIVGTGGMGKAHSDCYAQLVEQNPELEVIAAVDIIPEKTARVTSAHPNARAYDSLEAMFAAEQPDVVHLTTPSYLHAEMAVRCLERGIHVFSEKPMALNLVDAQKMCAAAKQANRFLMIGQVIRFWPQYLYLKQLLETQTYGRLRYLNLYRFSGSPSWAERSWFLDQALSGRAPVDLHLHDTDFIHYLLGVP